MPPPTFLFQQLTIDYTALTHCLWSERMERERKLEKGKQTYYRLTGVEGRMVDLNGDWKSSKKQENHRHYSFSLPLEETSRSATREKNRWRGHGEWSISVELSEHQECWGSVFPTAGERDAMKKREEKRDRQGPPLDPPSGPIVTDQDADYSWVLGWSCSAECSRFSLSCCCLPVCVLCVCVSECVYRWRKSKKVKRDGKSNEGRSGKTERLPFPLLTPQQEGREEGMPFLCLVLCGNFLWPTLSASRLMDFLFSDNQTDRLQSRRELVCVLVSNANRDQDEDACLSTFPSLSWNIFLLFFVKQVKAAPCVSQRILPASAKQKNYRYFLTL